MCICVLVHMLCATGLMRRIRYRSLLSDKNRPLHTFPNPTPVRLGPVPSAGLSGITHQPQGLPAQGLPGSKLASPIGQAKYQTTYLGKLTNRYPDNRAELSEAREGLKLNTYRLFIITLKGRLARRTPSSRLSAVILLNSSAVAFLLSTYPQQPNDGQ